MSADPAIACRRPSAPGVTRTRGQQFRKLLLYPSELRGLGPDKVMPYDCNFTYYVIPGWRHRIPEPRSEDGMLIRWTFRRKLPAIVF